MRLHAVAPHREKRLPRWERWKREMREWYPPPPGKQVRVRRARLDAGFGAIDETQTGWTITVSDRIALDFACYILEHEWAHMRVWGCGCEVDHCEHWAREFGAIHRDSRHDQDNSI